MLFWSRRAPITSPVGVTPGCRLSNSTTLRVSSGNCLTWRSENALPTDASTVLVAAVSDVTFTVSDALPTSSRRRSEEHTSELQSHVNLVCRLLLENNKS